MIKRTNTSKYNRGSAVLLILLIMVLMGFILYGAVGLTSSHTKFAWFNYKVVGTRDIAESDLKIAKRKLMDAINSTGYQPEVRPIKGITTNGLFLPNPSLNETQKLETEKVFPDGKPGGTDDQINAVIYIAIDPVTNIKSWYRIEPLKNSLGNYDWQDSANGIAHEFLIESVARDNSGNVYQGFHERVWVEQLPLFAYMYFYDTDLHFLAASHMEINGNIHTNGFLILDSKQGGLDLDMGDKNEKYRTTSAKSILRMSGTSPIGNTPGNLVFLHYYDDSGVKQDIEFKGMDGITRLPGYQDGDFQDPTKWALNSNWKNDSLLQYGKRFLDQSNGQKPRTSLQVSELTPSGSMKSKANILIHTDMGGVVTMTMNGTTTTLVNGMDYKTGSFYDSREDTTVKTTDLNLKEIMSRNSINSPDGVVIYAEREDAFPEPTKPGDPPRAPNGYRIIQSDSLSAPVTFATELPVYIEGDFNRHQPIDNMKPLGPTNDSWQPTWIISDATTVLSNDWNDAQNTGSFKGKANDPKHVVTTSSEVNAGFIYGTTPKNKLICNAPDPADNTPDCYSSGGENSVRLLEDWKTNGQEHKGPGVPATLNITGSFIQLWDNRFDTHPRYDSNAGNPHDKGYYKSALRNFKYEARFKDSSGLPKSFKDALPPSTMLYPSGSKTIDQLPGWLKSVL